MDFRRNARRLSVATPNPLNWGAVNHKVDKCIIAASGPSADALTKYSPKVHVITVNDAVNWSKRADFWFTLDPSETNKILMANRRLQCNYYAAVPDNYRYFRSGITYLRRIALPLDPEYSKLVNTEKDWGIRLKAMPGLSENKTEIHTGNSAYGALGLAYLMQAKKIVLCGVDGTSAKRVGGGYSRDLTHIPNLFATACDQLNAAGVQVVNASLDSRVDCFDKMTFEKAMEWVRD